MDTIKHLPTGNERILYIDHDEALVSVAKRILTRLGYEVTTRTSSIEALTLFRSNPDRFDLVITEMIMPGMSGFELSQLMLGIRPNLLIILCTDFGEVSIEKNVKEKGIRSFIHKPFLTLDLAMIVRRVLDEKSPSI